MLHFPYSKMVYMMEWHPLQVSQGHRESLYHNVIALCSSDKGGKITIVNVNSRNGKLQIMYFKYY